MSIKVSHLLLIFIVGIFGLLVFSSLFDHWIIYDYYVAKAAQLTGINTYLLKAVGIVFFVPLLIGTRMSFHPFSATIRRNGYIMTVAVIALYNLTFYFLTRDQNFAANDGRGLRWYSIRDGSVMYYDHNGVDPITGVQLQPVTPENAPQLLRWQRGEISHIQPRDGHFFNTMTGEPLIWYAKSHDSSYEFFDGPGFHPTTRVKLQAVTPEVVADWQQMESVRPTPSIAPTHSAPTESSPPSTNIQSYSTPTQVSVARQTFSSGQTPTPVPMMRRPERSWDRPHIYLQLANESQRKAANELRQRLVRAGYAVVGIENSAGNEGIPNQASEFRYFTLSDANEAQRISREIAPFFGITGINADLPEGMPYVSHARQYEIWFSQAMH